jgi:phosphate transport system permease protein
VTNKRFKKLSRFFVHLKDQPIEIVLLICASLSTVILFLMLLFVVREGVLAFSTIGMDLILGGKWETKSNLYGGSPLLYGSFMITAGALAISIPLGVCTAIFIAEILPFSLRDPIKSIIELLASIPSVIYGFVGLIFLVPAVASIFGVVFGETALTAAIILAIMTVPTIVSISGEIIAAVPKYYKEAALALGATKWQAIKNVVLPLSKSGILASIMLGLGRAIGETIAVSMIAGNMAQIPTPAWNYLAQVYTIPAFIANHTGEAAKGSLEYSALFGLALILLIITFIVNTLADTIVGKEIIKKGGRL